MFLVLLELPSFLMKRRGFFLMRFFFSLTLTDLRFLHLSCLAALYNGLYAATQMLGLDGLSSSEQRSPAVLLLLQGQLRQQYVSQYYIFIGECKGCPLACWGQAGCRATAQPPAHPGTNTLYFPPNHSLLLELYANLTLLFIINS